MAEYDYVYYRLGSPGDLVPFSREDIVNLDWARDIDMIRPFYRQWGDGEDVDPPGPEETGIGQPIALVRDGEILSFMCFFYFVEGEAEIGAVATLPKARNQGLCRSVISEAARQALERGLIPTLTTGADNLPMRWAAEAIGMRRVDPGRGKKN